MAITKIILPVVPRTDKLTWVADPKGLFSMKSAMVLIQRDVWPAAPDPIWHKFWKSKIHERLKTFVWRIGCGTLPTNLNIFSRMSKGDPRSLFVTLRLNRLLMYSSSVRQLKCSGLGLVGVSEFSYLW